jgi:hypothetical protein
MGCCNNDCLEFLSSNCVEYGGQPLTTLPNNASISEIVEAIDTQLSDNTIDWNNQSITLDLKCLGSGCDGLEVYTGTWALIANSVAGALNITLPFTPGSFILEFIKVYSAGVMVNSSSTYGTPMSIPLSALSAGVTVTISVMYNSPNGMIHFVSTIVLPAGISGLVGGTFTLNCVNSTIATISIPTLFQMLINKICT